MPFTFSFDSVCNLSIVELERLSQLNKEDLQAELRNLNRDQLYAFMCNEFEFSREAFDDSFCKERIKILIEFSSMEEMMECAIIHLMSGVKGLNSWKDLLIYFTC